MANIGLLGSTDVKAIDTFRKDLLEMLRIGKGMNEFCSKTNQDIDLYLKKFESLITKFNKKYKGLKLKLVKSVDSLNLRILLKDKDVKDVFANSASKVVGVQSIGAANYGNATVSDPDKFGNELEKAKNKLYITYFNPETGKSNVFLQHDKKAKKVELVYDLEDIENESSAEFQIAVYYALNKEYDKKIKIDEEAATLGFSLIPNHLQKRKDLEKFDPHITE